VNLPTRDPRWTSSLSILARQVACVVKQLTDKHQRVGKFKIVKRIPFVRPQVWTDLSGDSAALVTFRCETKRNMNIVRLLSLLVTIDVFTLPNIGMVSF
jgi:hypothetical protein